MYFAIPRSDEIFVVAREGIIGKKIAGVERFLIVALDGILQPAFFSRREVADAQSGLGFESSAIHKLAAVGRDSGAESASGRIRNGVFFAGNPVAADDLGKRELRVIGKALGPRRVVEIVAIERKRGPDGIHPLAPRGVGLGPALRYLHPCAAFNVVHPNVVVLPGKLAFAAYDYILPVGSEHRRGELDLLIVAELLWITAIGAGNPDILRAAAVAHKRDPLAVGRVARLAVEGQARGDLSGLAAGNGQRIEVA
jgi:hypothetical protein